MPNAKRDNNYVTSLLGVSSSDGITPILLYADPSTNRLLVDFNTGTVELVGTGSFVTGQQALSTSSAQVVASRATRRSITIVNLSAINIYVGATGVTSATGQLLLGVAGSAMTLEVTGAVFAVAASGTPSVSYIEEYA